MSLDGSVLLLLLVCCIAIAAFQAAEWPRSVQLAMALALAAALTASGEIASRTSAAEIVRWAASPQRRQDLAALLLIEALLFGSQAVRLMQTQEKQITGWLPPPSGLLSLFFAQVAVMLFVDGWDFGTLSWLCGLGFAGMLVAAGVLLRWALPDPATRCELRVALHGAQALAGLWLARPVFQATIDPVPLWGERLAMVVAIVAVLAGLGWILQRWWR